MSIQQNINQTLSLASFIGSQIMRTKQEKDTLKKAASAAEQEVRMEQAKQKFEEAETTYLEEEGRKKAYDEWPTLLEQAKGRGEVLYGANNQPMGEWHSSKRPKYNPEDLYKKGLALSGAADTYHQMGGNIPTETLARYRNLGTAEPPAPKPTTKKTKPEVKEEGAMEELAGRTRVEDKRLTGGSV